VAKTVGAASSRPPARIYRGHHLLAAMGKEDGGGAWGEGGCGGRGRRTEEHGEEAVCFERKREKGGCFPQEWVCGGGLLHFAAPFARTAGAGTVAPTRVKRRAVRVAEAARVSLKALSEWIGIVL
jgi:hypothetical protein